MLFDNMIIDTLWIMIAIIVVMYLILLYGRYALFEKILTVFVIVMGLCFFVVFFMIKPDITEILYGMIPSIPDEPGAFQLVAAMAGTTCSAAVFIIRSILVAEKGWKSDQLAGVCRTER